MRLYSSWLYLWFMSFRKFPFIKGRVFDRIFAFLSGRNSAFISRYKTSAIQQLSSSSSNTFHCIPRSKCHLFFECIFYKPFLVNHRFNHQPDSVQERRSSIGSCNLCITGRPGAVARFCCLRYFSSSCEILSVTPTLSNRSSPGRTFVRNLQLS